MLLSTDSASGTLSASPGFRMGCWFYTRDRHFTASTRPLVFAVIKLPANSMRKPAITLETVSASTT